MNEHNYCVILAGGQGVRFWPVSRQNKPKQFLDFFGMGSTLIQQTYYRMSHVVPAGHIYILTPEEYKPLVKDQIPTISEENLLVEPLRRNTGPAAVWATSKVYERDTEANLVVVPADQLIMREDLFQKDMLHGLEFVARTKKVLAMGVNPTRPEPDYGYIQKSEIEVGGCYRVQSFTEKPETEFAKFFVECREFLWNTGIFLWNAAGVQEQQKRHIEEVLNAYTSSPNEKLDEMVLEKTENVYVMECNFGWADIGSWQSFYDLSPKDSGDNVVPESNALCYESKGNVICAPTDHLVVVDGLTDYVVIEHDNVLVICPKNNAGKWRKYVNDVRMNSDEKFV